MSGTRAGKTSVAIEPTDGSIGPERLTLWASIGATGFLCFVLFATSFSGRQHQWNRNEATSDLLRQLEVHKQAAHDLCHQLESESPDRTSLVSLQVGRFQASQERAWENLEASHSLELIDSDLRQRWLKCSTTLAALAQQSSSALETSAQQASHHLAHETLEALDQASALLTLDSLQRKNSLDQGFHRGQLLRDLGVVLAVLTLFIGFVIPAMARGHRQHLALVKQSSELERLALVARSTTNAVMLTDESRRIIWANEAFTKLTGYSLEESLGKNPSELIQYEGTDPATVMQLREALRNKQGIQVQIRNRSKQGRVYWASLEIQPLYDANHVFTGFLSVSADITSKVELRERLQESDDRLSTATASAVIGLWDWYPVTDRAWFNDPWWTMIGHVPGSLPATGQTFFSLVHPDDRTAVQEAIQAHVRGERDDYRVEFRMRTADNSWRWIKAIGKITQRDGEGQPLRFSGVHLDTHLQRLALEAAASSELRLQTVAANVPGIIYQLRVFPDGKFSLPYVSPAVQSLFGLSPTDLLFDADPLLERIEADDRRVLLQTINESAGSLSEFRVEVRSVETNGHARYFEWQGKPEREWDGSVLIHGYLHDITQRRQSDLALRESERRFRDLADSVPVLVWLSGVDGKYTDFNKEWLAFTGRTLEQELGDGWISNVHPEDLPRCVKTYQSALESRLEFELEYRLRRHDGEYRWILERGHPRRDARGEFAGFIGGCLDVTDRRIAEVELARRESELRTVFANSPGIPYRQLNDASRRVLFVSDRIEELTGIPAEQFLAGEASLSDLTVSEDREHVRVQVRDAIAKRTQWSIEYRIRDLKGDIRWIFEQGSASFNVFGDQSIIDGFLVDVTALKAATHEAARWRDLATAIVESALDAVVSLDDQGEIVAWNSRATQMFGLQESEAREISLEKIVDCTPLRPLGLRRSDDAIGTRFETTAIHVSGKSFPVEVALTPTCIQGRRHCSVFIRDISSQVQARQDLENARRDAEAANRAKSEFLANMSHEIRTPMTAILGYADLLHDDGAFIVEPEKRNSAIDSIRRNGNHLLAIINDILDLSKIEAGKMQVMLEPVDPSKLAQEVVELLKMRAEEAGLNFVLELPEFLPSTIQTDSMRLRQILLNLLGNAIKFTEKGNVRLRLDWLDPQSNVIRGLDQTLTMSQLRLSVIDTGVGMSEQQTNRLFQPFCQVDSSMSRRFGGTGLGLTISKRLAENLGGTLVVSSQPGVGSCFSLILPIQSGSVKQIVNTKQIEESPLPAATPRSEASAVVVIPPRATPLSGIRILLAEDGPDNQRLISFLLKKAGAVVEVVENGKLACDRLLGPAWSNSDSTNQVDGSNLAVCDDIDVVLMDMQMPELDGYQATRQLRSAGYQLPIIALTAHAMAGDRERCMDAGCSDYATKPIDRQALVDLILSLQSTRA